MLRRLERDGVFDEMRDGYRLGVAVAIARGTIAPEDVRLSSTIFNVGTLDPDGSLRDVVTELYPDAADRPYAIIQRLAESGVSELGRLHDANQLRFGQLFDKLLAEQVAK